MENITSRKNEKVMHIKKLWGDRKYRYQCRQFVCDGEKLLKEAISNGAQIGWVFLCEDIETNLSGLECYRVSRELIEHMSPLKTAQSVIFSCNMPVREKSLESGSVILENIQDPGNVGTMIRTANALGLREVMLLGDCADIYNSKTMRAAMGAVFRQKICQIDYEDVQTIRDRGIDISAAAMTDDCIEIDEADLSNCVFAIGNEGNGITKRLFDMCTGKIVIPMDPKCESLNASAAAAIIMWEMRRHQR